SRNQAGVLAGSSSTGAAFFLFRSAFSFSAIKGASGEGTLVGRLVLPLSAGELSGGRTGGGSSLPAFGLGSSGGPAGSTGGGPSLYWGRGGCSLAASGGTSEVLRRLGPL